MKKKRRFEIVRRPNGRFGWIFVVRDGGRRRVRARSIRDYGSVDKVFQAIEKMQGADICDTTEGGQDPFPLPATSFQIVPGVVPLLVQGFPTDFDTEARRFRPMVRADATRGPTSRAVTKRKPEAEPEREAAAEPEAGSEGPAADRPKPRRGGRRSTS